MTKENTLRDMVELTGALYRAEQAKMRDLIEKENKLRGALSKLEANRKAALALPATDLQPIRQIGADILWQGWVGRNREDLNRQLALCLAHKARIVSGLKRAYGKHSAAKDLLENECAALRKKKDGAVVERDQNMYIVRSGML